MDQHQYDYAGHQPGCGVCAANRERARIKESVQRKERQTLDNGLVIAISYRTVSGSIIGNKTWYYPKGTQFNPNQFSLSTLTYGFDILDSINE